MAVTPVTDQTIEAEVFTQDTPTIIDFHAEWCAPCKAFASLYEELSTTVEGLRFVSADIEDNSKTVIGLNIRKVPAFMAFKGTKLLGQFEGPLSVFTFKEWLNDMQAMAI